jgi:hypothetical protein
MNTYGDSPYSYGDVGPESTTFLCDAVALLRFVTDDHAAVCLAVFLFSRRQAVHGLDALDRTRLYHSYERR